MPAFSYIFFFSSVMQPQLYTAIDICHTVGCVGAAATVLRFIDASVNPCDDFYQFACGKYINETILTDEDVSVDTFDIANDRMQYQLLRLIDSPITSNDIE